MIKLLIHCEFDSRPWIKCASYRVYSIVSRFNLQILNLVDRCGRPLKVSPDFGVTRVRKEGEGFTKRDLEYMGGYFSPPTFLINFFLIFFPFPYFYLPSDEGEWEDFYCAPRAPSQISPPPPLPAKILPSPLTLVCYCTVNGPNDQFWFYFKMFTARQ